MRRQAKIFSLKVFIIAVALLLSLYIYTFAAITANPITGESELTFQANPGSSVNPAEVRINITTPGGRYEVRQELMLPPSNGQYQIDWRNITMRGLRQPVAAGATFYAAQDAPMPISSFNPLYTNPAGTADQFTLIYYVNLPANIASGSYRGRLKYTFIPVASGQPQAYAFLNILINVGQPAAPAVQKPQIEISPLTGLNAITLNSSREEQKTFDVQVKINSHPNNFFTLSEIIREPLISSDGSQLDYSAIKFQTQQVKIGMPASVTALSAQPQKFFSSGTAGEAPESFILTYSLGDLSAQKAGRYKGRIQYLLDQNFAILKTLNLEVEIGRIFELVITPADQMSSIEFRDLKPSQEPKKNEVAVEIKTNTGKQYQVSQDISSPLSDKSGNAFPAKYFTMKTESLETKGKLKCPLKAAVKKGDTALFISDALGSPDKFKIVYELATTWDIKAGNYSTRVTYSLTEL